MSVVRSADLTEEDARLAGFVSREELVGDLGARADEDVLRVDFHFAGEDPRRALREDAELSPEARAELERRLDRLDRASGHGAWTRAALRLIGERPGTRAAELAASVGRETQPFKLDIRKRRRSA